MRQHVRKRHPIRREAKSDGPVVLTLSYLHLQTDYSFTPHCANIAYIRVALAGKCTWPTLLARWPLYHKGEAGVVYEKKKLRTNQPTRVRWGQREISFKRIAAIRTAGVNDPIPFQEKLERRIRSRSNSMQTNYRPQLTTATYRLTFRSLLAPFIKSHTTMNSDPALHRPLKAKFPKQSSVQLNPTNPSTKLTHCAACATRHSNLLRPILCTRRRPTTNKHGGRDCWRN